MTLLTWHAETERGVAMIAGRAITITEKPAVGFLFDSLYYEPQTHNCKVVIGGVDLALSGVERVACKRYVEEYYA